MTEQRNQECTHSESVYELLKEHSGNIENICLANRSVINGSLENIPGLRIVFCSTRSKLKSDHSDQHNTDWKEAITSNGYLEAGTITKVDIDHGRCTATATVRWDCGVVKVYTQDQWQYLRVYSLGPAGYLGQMVFCDKCLEPSKGLAFRLARENKSVGDLYDLCQKCYDECDDEHVSSPFYCNIPSGNIDQEDRGRTPQPPRQYSQKFTVMGIFKHSTVEIESTDTDPTQGIGEVLNIVHEKGQYDLRKSKYYDSCAEVKMDAAASGSGKAPLVYREAGSGGKVELKAVKPGEAPSPMPVEHYPTLGVKIIREMLTYKDKLRKINKGKWDCFMRYKDGGCYSLTISGTRLNRITDKEIWEECNELRIVILLMNELNDLPSELSVLFANSIELVCIQHNKFTKVPPIIFELKLIKHLNLHGNQISRFPHKMQVFVDLERLKFGQNKLYSLPDIFNNFKHLTEITFNNNFLTRLPPSFTELKQLESIDLRDNSFTCIPAPLLKLEKLKVLYMDWNRIQRLAPLEDHEGSGTFSLLRRLVSLRLSGNPVYEQLRPRLDKDGTTLLELVTNQATFSELHQIPISRALRVLVLGSCGAGKTSIVEALSFKKYVTPTSEAHHDHTVGIKRFSIPVQINVKEGEEMVIELRLWDFAGEKSYIMMNNLFLTDGTLIWIAVNFKKYDCTDQSFFENVTSWLHQVITRAVRPVIWVIGTHTDKLTQKEVAVKVQDIKEKIQSRCDMFQKELENELEKLIAINNREDYENRSPECVQQNIKELTKLVDRNVPGFVAKHLKVISLTNTYTFSGHENLKNLISNLLQNTPFQLTKALTEDEQRATDKLRQKAEELLAKKEMPVLNTENVLCIIERELGSDSYSEQASMFLQYLYETGHLLVCKPHPEIILDVDWLIDLLAQVFHHDFPAMVNEQKGTFSFDKLSEESIELQVQVQQKTGIVKKQLLEALWFGSLPARNFNLLIKLLETYGLAYATEKPSGCLFPWLVLNSCPQTKSSETNEQKKEITSLYEFSPCLPTCFLQQLVVKCKKHYTINAVYSDSFVVCASKKLSPNLADSTSTCLSVCISVTTEPKKMCGKITLSAWHYTQHDIDVSTHRTLLHDLWGMLMTIVKEMEALLCYWTFYGNLQPKVCCPNCLKPTWDLQLVVSGQKILDQVFNCVICDNQVDSFRVVPPAEFQLKKFVDSRSSSSPSSSRAVSIPIGSPVQLQQSTSAENAGIVYRSSESPSTHLVRPFSYPPRDNNLQTNKTTDQLSEEDRHETTAQEGEVTEHLPVFPSPSDGQDQLLEMQSPEGSLVFTMTPVEDRQPHDK